MAEEEGAIGGWWWEEDKRRALWPTQQWNSQSPVTPVTGPSQSGCPANMPQHDIHSACIACMLSHPISPPTFVRARPASQPMFPSPAPMPIRCVQGCCKGNPASQHRRAVGNYLIMRAVNLRKAIEAIRNQTNASHGLKYRSGRDLRSPAGSIRPLPPPRSCCPLLPVPVGSPRAKSVCPLSYHGSPPPL